MNITFRKAASDDIHTLTGLTLKLYGGDNTFESLYEENNNLLKSDSQALFLAFHGEAAVGFAHCSLRTDYVEGTEGGPVGYLEGIYVLPEYRLKGIAKAFIMVCENWARENECDEFASDCELDNTDSYDFHLKMGFCEANRLISFVKKL